MEKDAYLQLLIKMVKDRTLSGESAQFLNFTDPSGKFILGPQTSAQGNITSLKYSDWSWPKVSDYYYKTYDVTREEFTKTAGPLLRDMKSNFKKAVRFAGGLDASPEEINRQLENGYSIAKRNGALKNDDRRTWRMVDDFMSGKKQNVNNYMTSWKKLPPLEKKETAGGITEQIVESVNRFI